MFNAYEHWKKIYESQELEQFSENREALLWLKTKSIVRKDIISEFCDSAEIKLNQKSLTKQFVELFEVLNKDIEKSHKLLNDFIIYKNKEDLKSLNQKQLVSELYKVKKFEWGGDYQNSLDKYLVSHYVKAISSYTLLMSKFDVEINRTVRGYVVNSWYNHWSSILIEHLFKSHKVVLPTVGKIKSVDFFINEIPFDLKVTYFPAEFLKQRRKEKGFPVETTYLKSKAKELVVDFDKNAKDSEIQYEITEKLKNRNTEKTSAVLKEIKMQNMEIVNDAIANPKSLATWLYEKQGEMRFGSENRLFLVLLDSDNFSESWKLKRNLDLLNPVINNYLDNFNKKNLDDLKIDFTYQGREKHYITYADVIFVIK